MIKSVCLPNVVGIVNMHALQPTGISLDLSINPKVTIYYTDINLGDQCSGICKLLNVAFDILNHQELRIIFVIRFRSTKHFQLIYRFICTG